MYRTIDIDYLEEKKNMILYTWTTSDTDNLYITLVGTDIFDGDPLCETRCD